MGKTKLCQKNCKYEYKEIEYQLKKEKRKKKSMVFTTLEKKIQQKPLHRNLSKINENNHIKLSYNPKCKEKEEQHMVHTYQEFMQYLI